MTDNIEQQLEEADKKRIVESGEAELLEADESRMIAMRRSSELNRIAGDLPEDIDALWMFAERSLFQSAVSMIDTGRAFIKLKEMVPHGEFQVGLKERGISPRSARQIMAGARRFADRSEKLLKLGRTKLYACIEFSDDDLDTLEEGGSILDKDLDALDKMTTRELKDLVKKRDADITVKDQLLENKNKMLDDVATENAKLRGNVVEGELSPAMQAIESDRLGTLGNLIMLQKRALQMEADAAEGNEPDRSEYFMMTCAFEEVRNHLAQGMDALYNCGGSFQAALSEAATSTDTPTGTES